MGRMNAQGFAGAVEGGEVSLRMALYYHLRSNHYPPLPHAYAEVAEQAIQAAHEGAWEDEIPLPQAVLDTGLLPRTAVESEDGNVFLSVSEAIRIMHLDVFLPEGEL